MYRRKGEKRKMNELKINQKFKDAIPPLSDEEYANLRESIQAEGCRDAIIIWDSNIVDGHNRYVRPDRALL